jgi:hypothetical protein
MGMWVHVLDHCCYEDGDESKDHLNKINFPPFDGTNPKLWLGHCLDYFEMYFVSHRHWIKVSTMHLSRAAACWLQSVEEQVRARDWEQFTQLVMNRFGKDQHELLICQLFHIFQSGSVQEYIDKYTGLVDQLLAYGRNIDPVYYTMCFVSLMACVPTFIVQFICNVPLLWILPACLHCYRTNWWTLFVGVRFAILSR